MRMQNYTSIDEYIGTFPEEMQKVLKTIRQTIQKAAPEATEKISYGIPTFVHHGNLVHFAAYKDHYSFFPASSGINAFKKELGNHVTGKGTASFPLDKPLPLDLITKITEYRVKENEKRKWK